VDIERRQWTACTVERPARSDEEEDERLDQPGLIGGSSSISGDGVHAAHCKRIALGDGTDDRGGVTRPCCTSEHHEKPNDEAEREHDATTAPKSVLLRPVARAIGYRWWRARGAGDNDRGGGARRRRNVGGR
jgi:hypothetical protein